MNASLTFGLNRRRALMAAGALLAVGGAYVTAEFDKWGKVIKDNKLTVE